MRKIRWKEIAIIFQRAMNALNPVMRVGDQISKAILVHEPSVSTKEAFERARKLLQLVGIDPSRAENYPHEFSGGTSQRVMITTALACNPKLPIADEPVSMLDVSIKGEILKIMLKKREKHGTAILFITHDYHLQGTSASA